MGDPRTHSLWPGQAGRIYTPFEAIIDLGLDRGSPSVRALAKRWGWSKSQVGRFLKEWDKAGTVPGTPENDANGVVTMDYIVASANPGTVLGTVPGHPKKEREKEKKESFIKERKEREKERNTPLTPHEYRGERSWMPLAREWKFTQGSSVRLDTAIRQFDDWYHQVRSDTYTFERAYADLHESIQQAPASRHLPPWDVLPKRKKPKKTSRGAGQYRRAD